MDNEHSTKCNSPGDLVNRINDESPIRKWNTRDDRPLGDERKYVIEIPLEWWEELYEMLGVKDED